MVIDENPISANAIKELLLSLECYPRVVCTCKDALHLLEQGTVKVNGTQCIWQVILLDSSKVLKETQNLGELFSRFPEKHFVLMTRITERGVSSIDASNFSSIAKPLKRIALLDILVNVKLEKSVTQDKGKTKRNVLSEKEYGAGNKDTTKEVEGKRNEKDPSQFITVDKLVHSLQNSQLTFSHYIVPPMSCWDHKTLSLERELLTRTSSEGSQMPAGITTTSLGQSAEGISRRLSIGTKILLVEDNVTNQKVAVRMLGRLGYRCDISDNGMQVI